MFIRRLPDLLLLSLILSFVPCDAGGHQQDERIAAPKDTADSRTFTVVYQYLQKQADRQAAQRRGRQVSIILLQRERWQQLPDCPVMPDIRLSELTAGGRVSIFLVCPVIDEVTDEVAKGWKQRLSAQIDFVVPVLVVGRDLARGEVPGHLHAEERAFSSVRQGLFHHPRELDGYVTVRPVRAGTIMTADLVKKAVVVRRGTPVTIIASSDTVTLTTSGIAADNGRIGDIIPIKKDNGRVIRCQVMNAREVRPAATGGNHSP
ncbi:flagellar basal body P-ring formation chaperone FlgA [Endozoicomonas sp.]|uniref:flagellar basal body P-ring formation chaperone FlgA n=1 Tax=Endozoicomonas sp. TaxID=1892382 RepID=UPI003839EB20